MWSQDQRKIAYFQHEFYKECRKIKGFNGSIPYKPLFMRGLRYLGGEKWRICGVTGHRRRSSIFFSFAYTNLICSLSNLIYFLLKKSVSSSAIGIILFQAIRGIEFP